MNNNYSIKKNEPAKPLGGYWHYYDEATLREYISLPPEYKLEWLEQANQFLWYATPRRNREIWERFRKGEI